MKTVLAANPRRSARELCTFLLLSYAGAWIVASPMWLTGFHRDSAAQGPSPLAASCMLAMMLVPATVAIALTLREHRWPELPGVLGLRSSASWPLAIVRFASAAMVFVSITAVGLVVASGFGRYHPHLPADWTPIAGMLASALVSVPLYLGEEVGWQGYMLPRMLRFGAARGVTLGGIVWGLWHLPMTALGGSYPGHSLLVAVPAAVICAVGVGAVIAWIRLWSGSVWPAVAAHLGFNEFALPLTKFLAAPGSTPDPLIAGPLGVTTWPALLVVAGAALLHLHGGRRTTGTTRS
ncbi:CPBP family intramembrane glutamic endopeptidase [Nocardia arthritidis]|nr:CPBP family intramembrane glutamic endopeptidase [Nocardia arthritidis]